MEKAKSKTTWLYVMSFFYALMGMNHLINSKIYLVMMPDWLPKQMELIYISGVCEVAFAVMLLSENTRRMAAWLIIAMLIVFLPVHIQMIYQHPGKLDVPVFILYARIPLQFVFIWWAWIFTQPMETEEQSN